MDEKQSRFNKEELEYLTDIVEQSLQDIRPGLTRYLSAIKTKVSVDSSQDPLKKEASWQQIGSLSQLRAIVGGRFQNLKSKWLAAGFPLKEHKGDSGAVYTIDEEGWADLSAWVLKQGYESKLSQLEALSYFSIKK